MARRRPGTDWTGLWRLLESSLRGRPCFGKGVRVKERLTGNDDGLPRDHDFFAVEGHELVLRLAIRFCSLRTVEESLMSLPREAETLRGPANGDLPFPVPKLVCTMGDHGRR